MSSQLTCVVVFADDANEKKWMDEKFAAKCKDFSFTTTNNAKFGSDSKIDTFDVVVVFAPSSDGDELWTQEKLFKHYGNAPVVGVISKADKEVVDELFGTKAE